MRELLEGLKRPAEITEPLETQRLRNHLVELVEAYSAIAERKLTGLSTLATNLSAAVNRPAVAPVDEHLEYLAENAWQHIRALETEARQTFRRRRLAISLAGRWGSMGSLALSMLHTYVSLFTLGILALPFLGTRMETSRRKHLTGVLAFVESCT